LDSHALPQNRAPLPQPDRAAPQSSAASAGRFRIVPFVKEVIRRFGEDEGSQVAAALSFFTLVSLVPMLLVGVWALGNFLDSHAARAKILEIASGFLPTVSRSASLKNDLSQFLQSLVNGPKATFGVIGVLGLIWSASAIFLNMETALSDILGVRKKRGFIQARLVALMTMAILGVLLLGSLLISGAIHVIENYRIPVANFRTGDLPFVWDALGYAVSVALTFAMFVVIYKVIPNAEIEWKAALVGAAFSAVCFEAAKQGFGWYVSHFGNFNKTYGTLGIIIFLVTWTLYSYTIMLLGAEVADVYSERVLGKRIANEPPDPA
jgi:membrane protein